MKQNPALMKQLTLELKHLRNLQRVSYFGNIPNSKVNKELFKIADTSLGGSNVSIEEWKA